MEVRVHSHWLLTPFRLAIHQPTATAVIADVHLGYREARQQTGDAVPLLSEATQLAPLRQAAQRFEFHKVVVAGDLFECGVRRDLLERFLKELASLHVTFAGLVPGNHDHGWEAVQQDIPIHPEGFTLGDWRIVHQDDETPAADPNGNLADTAHSDSLVLGHWHPATRRQGRRVPCYLVGARRLILPAFSADAAGVEVGKNRRWDGLQRFGILGNAVREVQE